MAFDYHIDRARRRIVATFRGATTLQEIAAARAAVEADPDYDRAFAVVIDLLGADLSSVSAAELRDRATRYPAVNPLAIVVGYGFPFGMARMYDLASTAVRRAPLELFHDRADAIAWSEERFEASAAPPR